MARKRWIFAWIGLRKRIIQIRINHITRIHFFWSLNMLKMCICRLFYWKKLFRVNSKFVNQLFGKLHSRFYYTIFCRSSSFKLLNSWFYSSCKAFKYFEFVFRYSLDNGWINAHQFINGEYGNTFDVQEFVFPTYLLHMVVFASHIFDYSNKTCFKWEFFKKESFAFTDSFHSNCILFQCWIQIVWI